MSPDDRSLAELCAAAYTSAPTWAVGDVHACRTPGDDADVIAFRGTVPSNVEDWLRDFDAAPVYDNALGFVHQGFLDGASSIHQALLAGIGVKPVVLTGHSLGGALAIVTAALMRAAGKPPVALVTFGAPRVWRARLPSLLAKPLVPTRQYRRCGDPVPNVPWLFNHDTLPLLMVGPPHELSIEQHSIAGYIAEVP